MARDWKQTRLAEVCNFQNGFAFKNSDYVEEGDGAFEIFRMGHILRGGGFNPDGKKALVPQEQAQKLGRFLLNEGDILMCMTDMKSSMALLGHTARMPVSGRYLVNQRVGRITVKKPDVLDQRFLYYYSNSPDYIDWLRSHANSGVQVNLSTEAILNSPISFPPLPVQRRIAGILSAYDELMENSQRRIRILEAMARALYREWFVHFRFPGHEKHPRVASRLGDIPQGWEVTTFGELYNTGSGGTPSRARPEYFEDGTIDWVKSQELLDGFVLSTEERITERALKESSAKLFPANAVLIALYGATIGKLAILSRAAATNQACCAVLPKRPSFGREFAFLTLLLNRERIIGLRLGAAQQNISQVLLRNFECLKPADELVRRFSEQTAPFFDGILTLQRQIQNLRRTRDLLLPRLLSGQVNVS